MTRNLAPFFHHARLVPSRNTALGVGAYQLGGKRVGRASVGWYTEHGVARGSLGRGTLTLVVANPLPNRYTPVENW